jgi:hypothetical protein
METSMKIVKVETVYLERKSLHTPFILDLPVDAEVMSVTSDSDSVKFHYFTTPVIDEKVVREKKKRLFRLYFEGDIFPASMKYIDKIVIAADSYGRYVQSVAFVFEEVKE